VQRGVVEVGIGGEDRGGNGTGRLAVQGPCVHQEQQQGSQSLQQDVVPAGAVQGRREVEEPLLGGGARISDST
jgi:hypothetical protein